MRKLLLPFLIFFLLLWLFGGSWWYAQQQRVSPPAQSAVEDSISENINPIFIVVDGDFSVRAAENVSFLQSGHEIHIPIGVNSALFQLAEYLNQNPAKQLELVGSYIDGESNNSQFDNLGIARAEAMKSRFIRLGLEGHRIETKGFLAPELLFKEGVLYGALSFEVKEPAELTGEIR